MRKRRGGNVFIFAKVPLFFLRIFLEWKKMKGADEEKEE